jgi:hypothetical protein
MDTSGVVAYVCYRANPGDGARLVYAGDAEQARRLAATGEEPASMNALRHPPGDGLQLEPGCVTDPGLLRRAGLASDDATGLDCPSCGLVVGETMLDPAPCLCPRCGFRICEGQV